MTELVVESVEIDSIKPDESNARVHPKRNLEVISNSLSRFGQRKPLVIWKNTIIAGNGTWHAAKELGWTHISVAKVPSKWTKTEARAYALADNKSGDLADWDSEELARQLIELDGNGFSLEEIGFSLDLGGDDSDGSFLDDLASDEDENQEPYLPSGQMYQLPYGFTEYQREIIFRAIKKAKDEGQPDAPNALTHIAMKYTEGE